MNVLNVPPAAVRDESSVEMLRAWIAEGGLHCSLKIGRWADGSGVKEGRAWGMLLADLVTHIGNACHELDGSNRDEVVSELMKSLQKELASPTSRAKGSFQGAN